MFKIFNIVRKIDVKIRNIMARKKCKNNNFTILCNSCVGGVIYNKLGLPFLSPTINLNFSDKDFFKFIHNLDYYLYDCQLEFIETDKLYPVACLGDIKLDFVHYHKREDARIKWESRVKRINKENLYLGTVLK